MTGPGPMIQGDSAPMVRVGAPDLAAAFDTQATRIGATAHRMSRAQLGPRLAQLLRDAGCKTVALAAEVARRVAIAQALDRVGLVVVPTRDLRPTHRADAGVSIARLGVAETASVLLHSTSEDRRVELCVDVHVILLDSAALAPTLDSASAVLRDIAAHPPAYASLITGPSRSADIERQITIGVHGPRALHILLLEDRP
jgi:L-lactate dehydrogenase complex protein LldG